MPKDQDPPSHPLSLGHRPGLSHDSNTDRGYGKAADKFHKQRQSASSYPYVEEDDHEDIDDLFSHDLIKRVANKIATPFKSSDSLIGRSIDHSSFAGGNNRVGIGESVAKGLVPFPNMYKKRIQVGGGVNSPKMVSPGQYNRTGTYRGWSHAPVPADQQMSVIADEEDTNLEKVRALVRAVLKNNTEEQ